MAEETIDERVSRLSKQLKVDAPPSSSTGSVEDDLNADPGYQMLTGPERVLRRKEAYAERGQEPPSFISKPGTRELDEQGFVHKYVRPTLEGAGMIGGGVLGAPLGLVGGVAGSALGYAAGDTLSSALERMAGERPPIASPAQAGAETLRALTGGGMIEMGSRLVGRGVGAIGSKTLAPFASQYEGMNRTLDEVAKSKGIQLDPHEIIQSRPLALGHKVLENIPFTSGMIQRKELTKLEGLTKEWQRIREQTGTKDRQRMGEVGLKIQDTIDRELDRLGIRQTEIRDQAREDFLRQAGSPFTYRDLGEQTQAAITERHAGLKAIEKAAWDHVRDATPANLRVTTAALPKLAKEIEKEYENIPSFLDEPLLRQLGDVSGSGNKQYDKLLAAAKESIPEGLPAPMRQKLIAEATKGEQPGWTVDALLKLRSELSDSIRAHHTGMQRGDVAKGSADAYARVYTRLLKAVDEDLNAFSGSANSDLSQRLLVARAASGDRASFFNPKEHPAVAKAINADPARMAQTLIQPGSAAGYTELSKMVGREATRPVKQAFTNQLLDVGGKEADGLAGLKNRLARYGQQTLAEIYGPAELKQLNHLADQSSWMKQSPIGNPLFRELMKTYPAQVAPVILGHPDLTGKILRQFPHMRGDLRSAFMESLKPNEATPFPTQMLKHLNAYPAEVQKQLFSKQEMADFYQLANIIDRTRATVKLAENPSGTAQNLVTFATGGAVLKHPITSAPTILGTTALTKLYLSKQGRKFLLQGLVTPRESSQSAYIASQLLGIAGSDAIRDEEDRQAATEP